MQKITTLQSIIPAIIKKITFRLFQRPEYTVEEVHAIYSTNVILALAQSLLGIFTPIYIFQLTQNNIIFSSNNTTNGFLWVMSYLALTSLIVVIVSMVFGGLIYKWTLKRTMFYGQIFLMGSYAFLFLSEFNVYFMFISAILGGIHIPFYWLPYHIFFVKKSDDGDGKYGTETGNRDFFVGIVSALGPFIGSLIILQMGFHVLYAVAGFLILISTMPILLYVRESSHRTHLLKDVFVNYLHNKNYLTTTIALSGSIISNTVFVIFWSLMLFFGLHSFVEIGVLSSVSGAIATVLLIVVGRMIDKKGKSFIHSVGVVINTVLHLTRPFFKSAGFLYANGILDNINAPAYNVPFNAAIYEKSLQGSVSDFLVYREIVLHAARFILLILLGLILFYTDSWVWVFYLGAFGSLLTVFARF